MMKKILFATLLVLLTGCSKEDNLPDIYSGVPSTPSTPSTPSVPETPSTPPAPVVPEKSIYEDAEVSQEEFMEYYFAIANHLLTMDVSRLTPERMERLAQTQEKMYVLYEKSPETRGIIAQADKLVRFGVEIFQTLKAERLATVGAMRVIGAIDEKGNYDKEKCRQLFDQVASGLKGGETDPVQYFKNFAAGKYSAYSGTILCQIYNGDQSLDAVYDFSRYCEDNNCRPIDMMSVCGEKLVSKGLDVVRSFLPEIFDKAQTVLDVSLADFDVINKFDEHTASKAFTENYKVLATALIKTSKNQEIFNVIADLQQDAFDFLVDNQPDASWLESWFETKEEIPNFIDKMMGNWYTKISKDKYFSVQYSRDGTDYEYSIMKHEKSAQKSEFQDYGTFTVTPIDQTRAMVIHSSTKNSVGSQPKMSGFILQTRDGHIYLSSGAEKLAFSDEMILPAKSTKQVEFLMSSNEVTLRQEAMTGHTQYYYPWNITLKTNYYSKKDEWKEVELTKPLYLTSSTNFLPEIFKSLPIDKDYKVNYDQDGVKINCAYNYDTGDIEGTFSISQTFQKNISLDNIEVNGPDMTSKEQTIDLVGYVVIKYDDNLRYNAEFIASGVYSISGTAPIYATLDSEKNQTANSREAGIWDESKLRPLTCTGDVSYTFFVQYY